jgi:hypothetical protein
MAGKRNVFINANKTNAFSCIMDISASLKQQFVDEIIFQELPCVICHCHTQTCFQVSSNISFWSLTPYVKGNAIFVTGIGVPQNCETSRLPHYLDTDGGEVLSPSLSRRFMVLISVRGWVDPRVIVLPVGTGQLINPATSSRIKPATWNYCGLSV